MLRYGLYTRKSHDDKRLTEKSTGEQLAECKGLASRDDLRIVWQCEESKSAKTPGQRPLYQELITLIEKGRIDGILCWHVNRLVRNMEEGGKLVQLLIDGKIREIRTPHSRYRNGENILAVVIDAASATQHSIDLVHTVKRSMEGNFRAGGCNHKAPQGYRNIRNPLNSKRGEVEPDPDRWLLIRKAWDRFLEGGHSIRSIRDDLETWGYRIRATLRKPSRPMGYVAVQKMLRNPFYAGFVRTRGELVKGRHEAMVTLGEFRRAQELLRGQTKATRRAHYHQYAGLMKCGYCGQQVTAETKDLRGGPWEIYHCSDSYNRCTRRGLAAAKIDEAILHCIESIEVAPEALACTLANIQRCTDEKRAAVRAKSSHRSAALSQLQVRLLKLTEMWVTGLLTDEQRYRDLENQLHAEQHRLACEVEDDESALERIDYNLEVVRRLLTTPGWKLTQAPAETKAGVAQALGEYLFFGKERKIVLRLHNPLQMVVSLATNQLPLEPPTSGSGKQKSVDLSRHFSFGGRECRLLEVPERVFSALAAEELTLPPGFELEDQLVAFDDHPSANLTQPDLVQNSREQ